MEAERVSFVTYPSIWEEMNAYVRDNKAINLGQGFPSFVPPPFAIDAIRSVLEENNYINHQYSSSFGNLELLYELRVTYSENWEWELSTENFIVTVGASQALSAIFNSLIEEGDEVVMFEPYYDVYSANTSMCKGKIKLVSMLPHGPKANNWTFDKKQFEEAVNLKTKLILINTPQNVPGKVWSVEELEKVASVVKKYNAIVVADEVYMHLTYFNKHISIATLPGMFERTITVCSAAKTFSMTGWKVGWAIAPTNLIKLIAKTVTYQTFCCATPLQIAVARSLAYARTNSYYNELKNMYVDKVNYLYKIIENSGLTPIRPDGGFFILADVTKVNEKYYVDPNDHNHAKDWQFCVWLIKVCGVGAIPVTAFCDRKNWRLYDKYVRFACCKPDEELQEVEVRLTKLKQYLIEIKEKQENL